MSGHFPALSYAKLVSFVKKFSLRISISLEVSKNFAVKNELVKHEPKDPAIEPEVASLD